MMSKFNTILLLVACFHNILLAQNVIDYKTNCSLIENRVVKESDDDNWNSFVRFKHQLTPQNIGGISIKLDDSTKDLLFGFTDSQLAENYKNTLIGLFVRKGDLQFYYKGRLVYILGRVYDGISLELYVAENNIHVAIEGRLAYKFPLLRRVGVNPFVSLYSGNSSVTIDSIEVPVELKPIEWDNNNTEFNVTKYGVSVNGNWESKGLLGSNVFRLGSNDRVELNSSSIGTNGLFGFTRSDKVSNFQDICVGVKIENQHIKIIEEGLEVMEIPLNSNTTIIFSKINNAIRITIGEHFYQYRYQVLWPLYPVLLPNNLDSSFGLVYSSAECNPIKWGAGIGYELDSLNDNQIIATGLTEGWGHRYMNGASNIVNESNVFIEFLINNDGFERIYGFTERDSINDISDYVCALKCDRDGNLSWYEQGLFKAKLGKYTFGNKYKLQKLGDNVLVFENDKYLYLAKNLQFNLYTFFSVTSPQSASFYSPAMGPLILYLFSTVYNFSDQYAMLKRKLDGSYHRVNEKLMFEYDEDYYQGNQGILQYKIYNDDFEVMQCSEENVVFGDNRIVIDLENDCTGMSSNNTYILEVENDKHEKRYLRFRHLVEFVMVPIQIIDTKY